MRTIYDKIEGDVEITVDTAVYGMITGSATVAPECRLDLYGVCCQDLIVKRGAIANVFGIISRSAVNDGGTLNVHGIIVGALQERAGRTNIHPGALISGRHGSV